MRVVCEAPRPVSSPRLSLLLDAGSALINTARKRRTPDDATAVSGIVREGPLRGGREQAARFAAFVGWTGDGLPPTWPYALLTHLHFSLVNDARFPFPPLGLIHKRETIEVFTPLAPGAWRMRCELRSITEVERGHELSITSELSVDGALVWRSTTLAFRRSPSPVAAAPPKTRPPPPSLEGAERWALPDGYGRRYAALSNNVDPIHMSRWSARLMGHRRALMHGMWLGARGLSAMGVASAPLRVELRFLSPVYLPAEVAFVKTAEGFGLYSPDGEKAHLLASVGRPAP